MIMLCQARDSENTKGNIKSFRLRVKDLVSTRLMTMPLSLTTVNQEEQSKKWQSHCDRLQFRISEQLSRINEQSGIGNALASSNPWTLELLSQREEENQRFKSLLDQRSRLLQDYRAKEKLDKQLASRQDELASQCHELVDDDVPEPEVEVQCLHSCCAHNSQLAKQAPGSGLSKVDELTQYLDELRGRMARAQVVISCEFTGLTISLGTFD